MEISQLTRPWLESLSTDELVSLADGFGIDIPSELERTSIIEELMDISFVEKRKSADEPENSSVFVEMAALPKQYNISFIDVMIRDPLWVFVFWEIKEHDRTVNEKASDFGGYCLRVIPLNGGEDREESFTVAVNANDTARYLGFPAERLNNTNGVLPEQMPQPNTGRRYVIKLCAVRGTLELQLAVSRPFVLPEIEGVQDLHQNPCACLSGVRDFSTIKSTDRQFRVKRQ